jgi:hypothetical protein
VIFLKSIITHLHRNITRSGLTVSPPAPSVGMYCNALSGFGSLHAEQLYGNTTVYCKLDSSAKEITSTVGVAALAITCGADHGRTRSSTA